MDFELNEFLTKQMDMLSSMTPEELKKYSMEMEQQLLDQMGMTREEMLEKDREYRELAYAKPSEGEYSEEIAEPLKKYARNAVFVKYDKDKPISIGCSKMGGKPHLPKGLDWFYNESEEPLTFLMQLNFAETAPYDKEGIFPKTGILYFFYNISAEPWEWEDEEQNYKVFYYNGDISALEPADFPGECADEYYYGVADENCLLDECGLSFFESVSYPDFDEYASLTGDVPDDSDPLAREAEYLDFEATVRELCGYNPQEYSDKYHILGGYSVATQNSPAEEFDEDCIQLLQMTWYEAEKCGFMFGDGGKLYYYIKRSELEAHNFDNVKFVFQCS